MKNLLSGVPGTRLLAILLLGVVFLLPYAMPACAQEQQTRSLQGQVMNDADAPIPSAIVYLKNTKTLAVKTFIADKTGIYHFTALSPNIDYEVYAEKDGKKSDTKTLSSFDSKKQATINLKIK